MRARSHSLAQMTCSPGLECHLAQNKQARDQKVGCLGALERLEPGSLWLKVYVPC